MSVSGSWAVSYDTNDTSTVTGNPLTLGDSITFSASGETDQGWTVGMSYELDYGGVLDDLKATLDMGEAGKFTFGESAGGSGIRAVKNIVPAADTAVYSMSATTTAYGMARGISQTGYIGYDLSVGDITLSFDTSKTTGGTNRSASVSYTGIDGLQVVAGAAETLTAQANAGIDQETVGVKYTMGSITVAAQANEVDDASTSNDDEDATHIGVSFALSDQVSVSYAQLETDFGKSTKTADETVSGVGVSYTAGSMSIKAYAGKTENNAGSSTAVDLEEKGVTLSFSF
jgi:outer membrane protein OmpU